MHVDPLAVDLEPAAAVEDSSAPAAEFGDLALAGRARADFRCERSAVVDREIPIAVRPVRSAGPGTAQGDGVHGWQACRPVGAQIQEVVVGWLHGAET